MISSLRAMLELTQLAGTPIAARIPPTRHTVGNVPTDVPARSSALTINRAIGGRDLQTRMGTERFNLRLWAGSRDEAESHYQALAQTLRGRFNVTLPSGALLYRIDVVSPGSHLSDPDTGWPFCLVGIEATFSEENIGS